MPVSDRQMQAVDKRFGELEGRVIALEKRPAATLAVPTPPHKVSVKGKCGHSYSTGSSLEPGGLEEVAWFEMMERTLCPDCQTRIEQKERIDAGRKAAEGGVELGEE